MKWKEGKRRIGRVASFLAEAVPETENDYNKLTSKIIFSDHHFPAAFPAPDPAELFPFYPVRPLGWGKTIQARRITQQAALPSLGISTLTTLAELAGLQPIRLAPAVA